jgi:hypothetical protein
MGQKKAENWVMFQHHRRLLLRLRSYDNSFPRTRNQHAPDYHQNMEREQDKHNDTMCTPQPSLCGAAVFSTIALKDLPIWAMTYPVIPCR